MQIESIPFRNTTIKYYKINPTIHHQYPQDIIPGKYEGGLKIWECQFDLLKYLENNNIDFKDKKVIEIGCGHGLLGIASLILGASQVCFQDYNQDVLNTITLPTVQLNFSPLITNKCRYVAGDWQNIDLWSELIYNENNYQKIINLIRKWMKKDGLCILGNKHYYFGVGGNMPGFKDKLDQQKVGWETLLKILPEKGGNKKEIIKITLENV